MTMKFPIKYLLIISATIPMFTHCERDLNLDIRTNDKRLLVEGEFTNHTAFHHIKLHRSGSITTGRPQEAISGARIYVTDGVDTFRYVETTTRGWYQTPEKCCGIGGHTYHLSITDIDIDEDGKNDTYKATSYMPVPVGFDSLSSRKVTNYDNHKTAILNIAYYTVAYMGADFLYFFATCRNYNCYGTINDRLGTGEINRFKSSFKIPTISNPDEIIECDDGIYITENIGYGDTINFIGFNFTQTQFDFLLKLDNQVNGDVFESNLYDQLKIPFNLPTNIEPADKAAGYFFIYSVSSISKVYEE